MTTTGSFSTIRTTSSRSRSLSNSRTPREKKGKPDNAKLVGDMAFHLVDQLDRYNTHPRFAKKVVQRRLKMIVIKKLNQSGRTRRRQVIESVADQALKLVVDKGYIRIFKCADAKGEFTSEVTDRGRAWLSEVNASNQSANNSAEVAA